MPPRNRTLGELTAELETATLRALASAYHDLNVTFFGSQLRRPALELSDSTQRLGRWVRFPRTLELSRSLLTERGWGTVLEVLKHEMAHQFVDEVLERTDETAHGPAFQDVCAARGIDPRASGVPDSAPSPTETRALERVAKLLALAESPNEHEAHAATLAAQKLMLKYNIDQVTMGRPRGYAFRHLGRPTGRVGEASRILATLLDDHFFVEAIWVPVWRPLEGKRGTVLEVCGTPENLELAEYTYSFLTHTAEQLWQEHQRRQGTRRNQGRRQFLAGVMAGFREQLNQQQQRHRQTGLVYVGDPQLSGFFRQRHPRVRWTRHGGSQRTREFAEGQAAGRRIVLHRGMSNGPSRQRPLLPGRRS